MTLFESESLKFSRQRLAPSGWFDVMSGNGLAIVTVAALFAARALNISAAQPGEDQVVYAGRADTSSVVPQDQQSVNDCQQQVSGASKSDRAKPDGMPLDAEKFPELKLTAGTAWRTAKSVIIALDELPADKKLMVPRMANVVERILWIGGDPQVTMTLRPEIEHWVVDLTDPPEGGPKLVELKVETPPLAFTQQPIASADEDGVISLPARYATTHGEKLRFEPQPHKNTVGYWAVEKDYPEWQMQVPQPGIYHVEILQGCGKGHGGSEVELQVADQKLDFRVLETGHFQNFRWRHLGQIQLPAGDLVSLKLIAVRKVAGAVMDCREIRLVPVKDTAASVRRTGLNADGTRADGRVVPTERPNVLLILTDDQGTLDAGCYGSRDLFTPRIDGLASDGVRFTRAYSHTVCCPARAMLMTGRYPQRGGVNTWTQGNLKQESGLNMAASEVTLAESLQAAGYRTALFGKWHLGAAASAGPTTQGFDEFFGHRGGFIDNYNHFFLHGQGFHDLYRGTTEVFLPGEYFPDLTIIETKRFLSEHFQNHADQPFFAYLAFNIPHYPEQGDARFDQVYARTTMPRRSYGRMITTVDDRIGQVLDELDRHGVRDNTVIVFQSDNGHSEETYRISVDGHSSGLPKGHNYGANGGGGNTGKWRGHKGTFYEGGLRVPAVISFSKELPQGEACDQAITLCDWLPTILELCDVALPADRKLDGASLLPIIRDNARSHHNVLHWQWQKRWAVMEGDWKLISKPGEDPELVSLSDEAPESVNHAGTEPQIVSHLRNLHERWAAEVSDLPRRERRESIGR